MKLNASLLGHVSGARESAHLSYGRKLASRVEPGQTVRLADGSSLRVLQTSSSSGERRLRIATGNGQQQSVSVNQFAALGPVSPAMQRLASFVHRVIARDEAIDSYVKEAIRAAGYPVDETMNWAKYLDKMYIPLLKQISQDADLCEDAIRDVVVQELYQKKVLDPHSANAHFDPEHPSLAGKDLDKKVSAFLVMTFKHRKEEVVDILKRSLGVGAKGSIGLVPTTGLDQTGTGGDDSMKNNLADIAEATKGENKDIADIEGNDEVNEFLNAFKEYTSETQREYTAKTLNFITDGFAKGMEKNEIRDAILRSPEFIGRSGKSLDLHGYNYLQSKWGQLIREFAKDPANGWSDSAIARMITHMADQEMKQDKAVTVSSLRLAAIAQPQEQQQQNTAPRPAPVNPNVQQQNAVKQQNSNGLNMAQPSNDSDEDNLANQPKKPTIPPEIPGVNHTASEDTMKATEKKAGLKASTKFARLRRFAEEEPKEVALAIDQLAESFNGLAERLVNLKDNLDLVEAPEEASIREKVASRNKFARTLRRLANETPEELGQAINDFYSQLDEVLGEFENFADNLGVELTPEQNDEPEVTETEVSEETPNTDVEALIDEEEPAVA